MILNFFQRLALCEKLHNKIIDLSLTSTALFCVREIEEAYVEYFEASSTDTAAQLECFGLSEKKIFSIVLKNQ